MNVTQYIAFCRILKKHLESTGTMQEVLLSKYKDCKRGSMLVPVSNLLVCRLLRRKRWMELIRNNFSFPFETLFVQLQIASLNSCSSHSFLPLPIFFQRTVYTSCIHFTTTYTCYTVTCTPTPPVKLLFQR